MISDKNFQQHCTSHFGIRSITGDSALINSALDEEVAADAPASSPRIACDPVILTIQSAVTHDHNGVINVRRTVGIRVNATAVRKIVNVNYSFNYN